MLLSHLPLSHVAGTDVSPRHEWANSSENPQHRPLCGVGWVRHSVSKRRLQLQCSRRVTQVGGKWRGSAKLRHGPAPAHPARSGRCRCYGLRLAGRHAHLDQGGSSEALGPTDGAGSKKQGLGQTRRSSGRVRGRWWLPVKLWMVSGGEEGVLWQKWQCAVKSVFLLNSRFSSPAELRRLVSRFVLFVWVFMYVLFSAAWTMQSLLNSASVQWIHNSNGCQQSYFCGKLILHEAGLSCSEGVEVDWKHKSELKAEIASSTGDNYKRSAE